jgi:hypothetical protein
MNSNDDVSRRQLKKDLLIASYAQGLTTPVHNRGLEQHYGPLWRELGKRKQLRS